MLRILSRMVALLVGVAALSPISAQSIRLLPKPPRPFEVERLERWAHRDAVVLYCQEAVR